MPRFFTIGYGDRAGYERTPEPVRTAAHAQDARLAAEGAVIGIAGAPVQVRNPEASGVEVIQGPFLRSDLPIAGFALIEAADLVTEMTLIKHPFRSGIKGQPGVEF